MANIKDIFQSAANYAEIRMMYGTPEQVEDQHRRVRQADNSTPYPVLMIFEQQPAEISLEYHTYSNFIVLFASRIKSEKINSENETVFDSLISLKNALITGLCKTSGISGIYPSTFTHEQTKKLLLLSTDKICGLEIKFTNLQIKNC